MDENIELVAKVVSAYVTKNAVAAQDLPRLIADVFVAFNTLDQPQAEPQPAAKLTPAVPIRRSVTPDYIVCLEDGKKLKMLKRHLRTTYNMSPDEYRAKWHLPANYPMTAPNYAAQRSELAKNLGLGKLSKGRRAAPAPVVVEPTAKPKSRRKATAAA